MRVANRVVGQLQVFEQVHFTAGPDATIAVLVAGEILEDRLHLRAVRVSRMGQGNMPAGGETAIGPGAAVQHETVKVRMGGVARELADLHSTWKGGLADLRAFELTGRIHRKGEPETCRVGPRRHV